MTATGADILCDTLLAGGIDVCFANPGTSEMHFVAALDRKPAMRCILGLFEGVATGAADGYGRMAGRPAAVLLHTGPGLANGLANLHNARRARSPVVTVVGDHAAYHLPFDAPLTSDIEALARPMSDFVRRTAGAGDVRQAAGEAIAAAQSPPGVATLILPADSAWSPAPDAPPAAMPSPPPPAMVPAQRIGEIARAMRAAGSGRVGLFFGGAAARAPILEPAGRIAARTGVRLFGEVLCARIERGQGVVPVTRIPYPVDMAVDLLKDIDLMVLVGAPEPVAFFAYPGKRSRLLREDCAVATLAAHGEDAQAALAALADEFGAAGTAPLRPPAPTGAILPAGPLTEDAIAVVVASLLPEGAIVSDEGLTSGRRFYALSEGAPHHDLMMVTGGAIGVGIPLATGAAVACPGRKVISLQADGSGMYTVQGLWTQAREGLDVLTVVYSNRAYAILQHEMRNVGVTRFGRNADRMMRIDEPALDWVSLARGMGVEAARADTAERFADLFRSGLARKGPFLIEAVI